MSAKVTEIIGQAVADYEHELRRRFDFMKVRCESPIEEMFLAAMLATADRLKPLTEAHFLCCDLKFGGDRPAPFNAAFVYLQTEVGPYRADFFIDDLCGTPRKYLAVELDGHDFHERTKEQAGRDKRRDRYFAAAGIKVLRFTGSEIFADPVACAEEVFAHLGYGEHSGR